MKVRVYNTIPAGLPPAEVVLKQREKNVDTSELSRVLKLVYAADNRTGLPAGELSVLASDSVPPEVAQWIRSQLLIQTTHLQVNQYDYLQHKPT